MSVTVSIHQQFGLVGIDVKPARFDLKRTPPQVSIERTPPRLEIQRSKGELSIDLTEMRESIGYGGPETITARAVEEARQAFDEGLAEAISFGDQLMRLHDKVTVADLAAKAKVLDTTMADIELAYIAPPKIHYEPGSLTQEGTPGTTKFQAQLGDVEMVNFQPHSVRTYLQRRPSIEIETKGSAFDFKV